eukprot:1256644-Prorocentrum_lima.AAC.1
MRLHLCRLTDAAELFRIQRPGSGQSHWSPWCGSQFIELAPAAPSHSRPSAWKKTYYGVSPEQSIFSQACST